MEMKKCVIFGAGDVGTKLYKKLSQVYNVIAYSDNNRTLWGTQRNQTQIVPPDELPDLVKATGAMVVIANAMHYSDIAKQLDNLGLQYYICKNIGNLTYTLEDDILYPASLGCPEPYRKPENGTYSVLFVQGKPCVRTNKIAAALKRKGVFTYLAYTTLPSDMKERAFDQSAPFWTYADLFNFVNESEFDVVHCSNTPDILLNILLHSNKKVVHDCHDVVTLSKNRIWVNAYDESLEFIANTQADGMIYTTEKMRNFAARSYGIKRERTLILGNYPPSEYNQVERLPKLSAVDGQIHCVYEGGIVDRERGEGAPHRFYEPLFIRLANAGVHIHIYSPSVTEYLEQLAKEYDNIHYEGNYNGLELIRRMTQYDLGFAFIPLAGHYYANMSSPNKVYEYLSAGLPVVTNVGFYLEGLEDLHCGGVVDLEHDDVFEKLRSYQKILIPKGFCDAHGLTVDANANRILAFYKKISMS